MPTSPKYCFVNAKREHGKATDRACKGESALWLPATAHSKAPNPEHWQHQPANSKAAVLRLILLSEILLKFIVCITVSYFCPQVLWHSTTNKWHRHVLSNLSNICTPTNSGSPLPALRDFSQPWLLGNNLYSAAMLPEWDQVPGWAQELCFMWRQDNSTDWRQSCCVFYSTASSSVPLRDVSAFISWFSNTMQCRELSLSVPTDTGTASNYCHHLCRDLTGRTELLQPTPGKQPYYVTTGSQYGFMALHSGFQHLHLFSFFFPPEEVLACYNQELSCHSKRSRCWKNLSIPTARFHLRFVRFFDTGKSSICTATDR